MILFRIYLKINIIKFFIISNLIMILTILNIIAILLNNIFHFNIIIYLIFLKIFFIILKKYYKLYLFGL